MRGDPEHLAEDRTMMSDLDTKVRELNGIVTRLRAALTELWPRCEQFNCNGLATVSLTKNDELLLRGQEPTAVVLCDVHAKGAHNDEWVGRRLRGVDELDSQITGEKR